ncbi:MAG: alpha/beta hydrolase [Bdellovibrionota bacterium]
MRLFASVLGLIFLFSIQGHTAQLPGPSEFPVHEVITVPANDGSGVRLSLVHVVAKNNNKNRPVLVLLPGFTFTAYALVTPAIWFLARGYDVYIAQPRSAQGEISGLKEVIFTDYPAQIRALLARVAGKKIHLLGHSMGGVAVLSMLSRPECKDIAKQVKTATVLMGAGTLNAPPAWIHLPIIGTAYVSSGRTGPGASDFLRLPFSFITRLLTPLTRPLLDFAIQGLERVSDAHLRTFLRWGMGPIPTKAYNEASQWIGVDEARIDEIPVFLEDKVEVPLLNVAARYDQFVSAQSVADRHQRMGGRPKVLVEMRSMEHVSPTLADLDDSLWRLVLQFHQDPRTLEAHILIE